MRSLFLLVTTIVSLQAQVCLRKVEQMNFIFSTGVILIEVHTPTGLPNRVQIIHRAGLTIRLTTLDIHNIRHSHSLTNHHLLPHPVLFHLNNHQTGQVIHTTLTSTPVIPTIPTTLTTLTIPIIPVNIQTLLNIPLIPTILIVPANHRTTRRTVLGRFTLKGILNSHLIHIIPIIHIILSTRITPTIPSKSLHPTGPAGPGGLTSLSSSFPMESLTTGLLPGLGPQIPTGPMEYLTAILLALALLQAEAFLCLHLTDLVGPKFPTLLQVFLQTPQAI